MTTAWENLVPLEPDTVLSGDIGAYVHDVWFLGDVSGDGLGDLASSRAGDTAIFWGPLLSGSISLDDADATLTFSITEHLLSRAGDVDADGIEDLWLGTELFLGPFGGERTSEEFQATIATPLSFQPVGGFDADGDGHLDVVLANEWLSFEIHYGPFEGVRNGAGHASPDPELTRFDGWRNDCMIADSLYAGPFGHADEKLLVLQGIDDVNCNPVGHFVDLAGPRGRQLTPDDAVASTRNPVAGVIPDSDGDGLNELVWANTILDGPQSGTLQTGNDIVFAEIYEAFATPDVSGDGLGDLVVVRPADDDIGRPRHIFVVPGTVRGTGLAVQDHGLFLTEWEGSIQEFTAGDLDGDGLAELIGYGGTDGEVFVWRGADVRAAMVDAGLATP